MIGTKDSSWVKRVFVAIDTDGKSNEGVDTITVSRSGWMLQIINRNGCRNHVAPC